MSRFTESVGRNCRSIDTDVYCPPSGGRIYEEGIQDKNTRDQHRMGCIGNDSVFRLLFLTELSGWRWSLQRRKLLSFGKCTDLPHLRTELETVPLAVMLWMPFRSNERRLPDNESRSALKAREANSCPDT